MPSRIKGEKGTICIQLIHKRKIKLLRTRFRLLSSEWDSRLETVITGNAASERQIYLQTVQTGLEAVFSQIYGLIIFLEKKGEYTVDELSDLYVNNSFNGYLFPFIDYIVRTMEKENRHKSASILMTARRSFERFRCGQDIMIDRIDNGLIIKYEAFLRGNGLKKNTVSCYMRSLRSVYNQAVKRGLVTKSNLFANVYTRIDKTVKRAVNDDVVVRLKNLDLRAHHELALARDLFMFSFYMRGISFVDMARLRKSNVRNGYIVYSRSKTKRALTVKIEPGINEIILRYESQTVDDYLLPVFTTRNCNNTSLLRNYNKRLKRISKLLGLEIHLSSYVTRHTWATIALRRGIPVEVISEGMGHNNEATTRIYLASIGQSAVDKANAEIIEFT